MTRDSQRIVADTQFGFLDKNIEAPEAFNPVLIANDGENTMLRAIKHELRRAKEFKISVAFITEDGLAKIKQDLLDFPGQGTIITSDYLGFNEPRVFRELLSLPPNIRTIIHDAPDRGFHPKGYIFELEAARTAIIGSSNLTRGALLVNQEWNLRFSALPEGHIVEQLDQAIDRQIAAGRLLDEEWIAAYTQRRQVPRDSVYVTKQGAVPAGNIIEPNAMQIEALENINRLRAQGEQRALVISATGTGKTILGALAVRSANPKKFLFLVHTEQILDRAMLDFQKALGAGPEEFGKFAGSSRELRKRYTFATIASLSRPENLYKLSQDYFDFIIVDEVHRSEAVTYVRIIEHLRPDFLLGLTATPERTDGKSIFERFHHNVAYEIRLQKALEEKMLVPFNYYGVTDYTDNEGNVVDDEFSSLARLCAPERVKHIVNMLNTYGFAGDVKGLIFCSRVEEAEELSRLLNKEKVYGRTLRTLALSSKNFTVAERQKAVERLEKGELDYLLTVDIFNEGIDIRSVNQIVMLRPTQSSIIFTQQLGRGLRKCEGKDHLRVIDFIGNYKNNFLIPIALFGERSLRKDKIRRKMTDSATQGAIAGLSSVNFDQISRERIFESLAKTRLDTVANLNKAVSELSEQLGRPPTREDVARYDTVDVTVLAEKEKNYWSFLAKYSFLDAAPSDDLLPYLQFLDREILPSKRSAEVLVLELLLNQETVTKRDIAQHLSQVGVNHDLSDVDTAVRVLTLEFFPNKEIEKYKNIALAEETPEGVRLDGNFRQLLQQDAGFKQNVWDVVNATKYLVRHQHSWSGELVPSGTYTRDEVCRMLNFQKLIIPQNIGGYYLERDQMDTPRVCPIFITYHKGEDISATVKYEDRFLDSTTLRWFTKNRRTLESKTERYIIDNLVPLPVFMKKDDTEGVDFYFLGYATAHDAEQATMPAGNGSSEVDVVHMKLKLDWDNIQLYDYFVEGVQTS